MRSHLRALSVSLLLMLFAVACGSESSDADVASGGPSIIVQGEQVLDATTSTSTTTTLPADAAGGATEGGASASNTPEFDTTEDALPQEEEDPDAEFFDAVGEFMACLDTEGYSFIGVPSRDGDPTELVNDPGYGEALGTCAALTQIVAKMTAAEDTSSLTAEEIEEQNRGFGMFVDCLIGKGWTIPTPTPDENGVLQPPYIEIAQTWTPPDGSSLLDEGSTRGGDFAECGIDPTDPTNFTTSEDE